MADDYDYEINPDELTANPQTLLDELLQAYIRPDTHGEVKVQADALDEALDEIEDEVLTPNRGRSSDPDQIIRQLLEQYPSLRTIARKLEQSGGKVALKPKDLLQLIQIVSAIEDGKKRREEPRPMIHGVLEVAKIMAPLLVDLAREQSWLLVIDGKDTGRLVHKAKMAQGSRSRVHNDLDKIVQTTRKYGKSFIRVHNHPSGSGYASEADLRAALHIGEYVQQFGLYQVDSIVVAKGGFNSCRSILKVKHKVPWPGEKGARRRPAAPAPRKRRPTSRRRRSY